MREAQTQLSWKLQPPPDKDGTNDAHLLIEDAITLGVEAKEEVKQRVRVLRLHASGSLGLTNEQIEDMIRHVAFHPETEHRVERIQHHVTWQSHVMR